MTCDKKCWYAKGDVCRCQCDGENHGIFVNNGEENELVEIILTYEEAVPFWNQMKRHNKCTCGYTGIHNLPIYGYEHNGGWKVRNKKYWLWIRCPQCDYEWSLIKLGVGFFHLPKVKGLDAFIGVNTKS